MPSKKDSLKPDDSKRRNYYNSCGILPAFHDTTFEQFINDDVAKAKIEEYLSRHTIAVTNGYGLYLYGENGVGKTHLMMCVLKGLLDLRYSVRSITLGTLIKLYTQEQWGRDEVVDEELSFNKIVKGTQFLEIEEVGKEYRSGETDLGRSVLDTVVRLRLQLKKPILFTTNKNPEQIEEVYTHDIASMLFECVIPVKVEGKDMRIKKHIEMKKNMGL